MDIRIQGNIIFLDDFYDTEYLNQTVQNIVNLLSNYEVVEDEVIALSLSRTPLMVCTIFALLQLRIPFFPVDGNQAKERLEYMLVNANIRKVILDEPWCHHETELEYIMIPLLLSSKEEITERTDSLTEQKKFHSSLSSGQNFRSSEDGNRQGDIEKDLAYLLYTSGSTGKPKAVEVLRSGLENFLCSIPKQIQFPKDVRIACFTKMTFDIFFLESVLALYSGFTVVLAAEKERTNPKLMIDLIIKKDVNVIQMTPSALQMLWLADRNLSFLSKVHTVMVGGEDFPQALLQALRDNTRAKIYNMYGPTETTIWSSVADLTEESIINIGLPLDFTKLYLLDEKHYEVTSGSGEIAITGQGLANGYRNAQELTNERFITLPFGMSERAYCTGDIGRYLDNGRIVYLGRKDNQVKVRGHRIELEEVDNALLSLPAVCNAMTCYQPKENGGELITFLISDSELNIEELKLSLEDYIPSYMVPKIIVQVSELKYNDSGKKDRSKMLEWYRLVEKEEAAATKEENEAVSTLTKIIHIFQDVMEQPATQYTKMTPIEEYGIDSFGYVTIIVRLEEEFGISLGEEALSYDAYETIAEIEDSVTRLLEINN